MAKKDQTATKGAPARLDYATLAGVVVGLGGILLGLILEGGKIQDVSQFTAALIVLGGTLGAVMITTPSNVLMGAARKLASLIVERTPDPNAVIEDIVGFASKARREGIVSLEQDAERVPDPFLRKALNLAVDGTDLLQIRKMMELEIGIMEHQEEAEAKVYEAAGGYSPTIGIIGAVLGLIQVMKHLADIDEVGRGIAVAFVATVYGVGAANLFFLPAAQKLRARGHHFIQGKELMLEGVVGIVEGLNPKLLRVKLEAYAKTAPKAKVKKPAASSASATQAARAGG